MAISYVRANVKSANQVSIPESFHGALYEMAPWSTKLLNLIGFDSLKEPCTNVTHKYHEMSHIPERTTLHTTLASGDTTIVLDTAVANAGDWIKINEEVIKLGKRVAPLNVEA